MSQSMDVITLRGLSAIGHHGVHDYERSGSQVFSADLTLYVDSHRAAETDDVKYTVDYSIIAEEAVAILTGSPVYLLETLASRLANKALQHPLVVAAEVTVHKPMAPVHHKFNDVSVTIKRDRQVVSEKPFAAMTSSRIILSLGSNVGDSRATLRKAVLALMELQGLEIDDVSPLVISRPVLARGQKEQPDYFNAVVDGRTTLSPQRLLEATRSIENQFGRKREENWGPRTLDIDLIDYDNIVVDRPDLQLPHPLAASRAFVLYPWGLMSPEAIFDGGKRVVELADRASDRNGILRVMTDWLTEKEQEPRLVNSVDPQPATPHVPVQASPSKVSIRGNRVTLDPIVGDSLFQSLLNRSAAIGSPAPERIVPKRMAVADVDNSVPVPVPRPVVASGTSTQLPDWRFGPGHESVRIVDSTDTYPIPQIPAGVRHLRRRRNDIESPRQT